MCYLSKNTALLDLFSSRLLSFVFAAPYLSPDEVCIQENGLNDINGWKGLGWHPGAPKARVGWKHVFPSFFFLGGGVVHVMNIPMEVNIYIWFIYIYMIYIYIYCFCHIWQHVTLDTTAGWKEAHGCWQQDMSKCSNFTEPLEDVHTFSIMSKSDGSDESGTGDWGSLAQRKRKGKMVKNDTSLDDFPFMALRLWQTSFVVRCSVHQSTWPN